MFSIARSTDKQSVGIRWFSFVNYNLMNFPITNCAQGNKETIHYINSFGCIKHQNNEEKNIDFYFLNGTIQEAIYYNLLFFRLVAITFLLVVCLLLVLLFSNFGKIIAKTKLIATNSQRWNQ